MEHLCTLCNGRTFDSKQGLSVHMRACKIRVKNDKKSKSFSAGGLHDKSLVTKNDPENIFAAFPTETPAISTLNTPLTFAQKTLTIPKLINLTTISTPLRRPNIEILAESTPKAATKAPEKSDCQAEKFNFEKPAPVRSPVRSPQSPDYQQLYIKCLEKRVDFLERSASQPSDYHQLYIKSLEKRIESLENFYHQFVAQSLNKQTTPPPKSIATKQTIRANVAPQNALPKACPTAISAASSAGTPAPISESLVPSTQISISSAAEQRQNIDQDFVRSAAAAIASAVDSVNKTTTGLSATKLKSASITKRKRVEIFGDSMIGGVNPKYMCSKHNYKLHSYGGATTQDMPDLLRVGMRRKPDSVIIHSGSNDLTANVNTLAELEKSIALIRNEKPNTDITVSLLLERNDRYKHLNPRIRDLNNQLKNFCKHKNVGIIEHPTFDLSFLSTPKVGERGPHGGLHTNSKGNSMFARDFKKYIES